MLTSDRDETHLLFPLCIAAGILIVITPILHPYGTCADWLMKWGDLYMNMRGWVMIHKLGMWGFALASAIGFFLPILGKRTYASLAGGACLGLGSAFTSMIMMIHSTATSSIGTAWIKTTIPERKDIYRA